MKIKRILAALLAVILLITSYGTGIADAAPPIPVQGPPNGLGIKALYPGTQPPIGYNASDGGQTGFYADFAWNSVPNPGIPSSQYVNIYLEESPKGYRPVKPAFLKERDLPAGTTPIRMRNLTSGTVYKANATAYYQYTDAANTVRRSDESSYSNTVKFLTDINLQCLTMGTNKIKIIWDDVWNNGSRINYRLYVSQNSDFANTLPIFITQDQIGENGPVTVNQADGTLEYEHTVSDPGRAYYVKIVPDIADPEIVKSESTPTVIVATYILVRTTKVSTNEDGTVWRLDWSPVVTGISSTDIKVQYRIDKYLNGTAYPIMVEDGTSAFITVPYGEESSYYQIRAEVTKNGLPYYPPNIQIISDKILLKESDVPSTPPMPEIVPEFRDSTNSVIISYEDILAPDGSISKKGELGKDTATILWRAPKRGDGSIDTDTYYDIWLIEDPAKIDNPDAASLIQRAFQPSESNFVRDATAANQIVGYKYKLDGLKPNHTYYFKIVAKKTFAEDVDGVIQNVEHSSLPAMKVVTTLPGGAIDTPLIPSNPPLSIRKYTNDSNRNMITDNSITIQTKNRWYEEFNKHPYEGTGKWYYVKADKDTLNDDTMEYDPIANPPDNLTHRKVEYGEGVTLYVGCEEYYEGIDISAIDTYKLEKVPVTPNDDREDPTLNVPENIPSTTNAAIYAKHNVVVPVNDLKPNTTYILWVRAVRDMGTGEDPLYSDVSNPIIFTTLPSPTQVVEKPIVPTFTYSYAADTYVDLGWDYKEENTYYIKYGTVDDPNKAGGTITVTGAQIKASGVNYVRIPGLKADTLYYFWIQAEAFSQDRTLSEKSDWSDSFPLRTQKDIPPATPRGFGVKNTADAVTKNSITFEWIQEPGLEYILEISGGVDYKDVKEYQCGAVSEFKVDGLTSNFRYFARLYAYDPVKKLRSIPTQSISVRTLRSSDDYDSDQDVDNVISGDIVEKAPTVVNGTWIIKIVGVNADRLIELMMTDNKLDYTVDASNPPSSASYISIYISKKVFDKLTQLKENIAFKTATVNYNLKAGILSNVNTQDTGKEQIYLFSITLIPQSPRANVNELLLRQPLAQLGVSLDTGVSNIPVSSFALPLIISYPYKNTSGYVEGKTYGYQYNSTKNNWDKQTTSNRFDPDNNAGVISFQSQTPGIFGVADRTNALYDDIYGYEYEDSIINVAYVHPLKSVQGRMFRPEDNATVGEAVRLVYDTIDNYNYGNDYMETAVKAGFIKSGKTSGTVLTRQEAASMAVVLYEIKSGSKVTAATSAVSSYSDYTKIDKSTLGKVAFAVQNGFVPVSSNRINPTGYVTRGELMYMIEKALALAGEIE